jgi:hypothetical protein
MNGPASALGQSLTYQRLICWSARCDKPRVFKAGLHLVPPLGWGAVGTGSLTNTMNFVSTATLVLSGGLH